MALTKVETTHQGKPMTAFAVGPAWYEDNRMNINRLSRNYSHLGHFLPATTSETISIISPEPGSRTGVKGMFSNHCLHVGGSVNSPRGVYLNVLALEKDRLAKLIGEARESQGVYFGEQDFAFVPYDAIVTGRQSPREFARGSLGRALEYSFSRGEQRPLLALSSAFKEVVVLDFRPSKLPNVGAVGFSICADRLFVGLQCNDKDGYAYAVFKPTPATRLA